MFPSASMEGETKEKTLQGRKMVGSLGHIRKDTMVSMKLGKGLCGAMIVQTHKTWVWNTT